MNSAAKILPLLTLLIVGCKEDSASVVLLRFNPVDCVSKVGNQFSLVYELESSNDKISGDSFQKESLFKGEKIADGKLSEFHNAVKKSLLENIQEIEGVILEDNPGTHGHGSNHTTYGSSITYSCSDRFGVVVIYVADYIDKSAIRIKLTEKQGEPTLRK